MTITNKNVDIPFGSTTQFGVLKVGNGLSVDTGVVSLNTSGLITDTNLSTKVESVVGTQSTLTTTAKTLVGAVNELDSELSTLSSKVDNIDALKVLNKDVITATEDTVQTVATNYIQTEYNRAPNNNDGLIITINGDKILYIYSSYSSKWVSAGAESIDISNASYDTKGILSVKSGTGLSISNGELSLNDLSGTYLTLSTAQDVSGAKRFDSISEKVADNDYRALLTTPKTTSGNKRYLLGQEALTNGLTTNTNESVYMENNKLFSNGSEVLNLLDNQTITGKKTFGDVVFATVQKSNYMTTTNARFGAEGSAAISIGADGLQAVTGSNTAATMYLNYFGGHTFIGQNSGNYYTKVNGNLNVTKGIELLGGEDGYILLDGVLKDSAGNQVTVEQLVNTSGGGGGDGLVTIRR